MQEEIKETSALLTANDSNHSEAYHNVRSTLNEAYYPGKCGYLRPNGISPFAFDRCIKPELQKMDTAELRTLHKTVSNEASRFWWQKISCYGVSGVSAVFMSAITILAQVDSNTSAPLIGTAIGLGSFGCAGFYRLGWAIKQRECLANQAVEKIQEVLTSKPAI